MTGRATSTSSFGVSRRESHDASAFYSRFTAPVLSSGEAIHEGKSLDKLIRGDARSMNEVPDASVALVVTSPPYFAGKEYEEALGHGGVPATYLEYLDLLRDVFAECVQKLEPGGRIAVNVANLGRRPYRSLSADVIAILQDDLRLLLRGEIIWLKQRGSTGSCAWGSFQHPANPVLRDLTERVIVASKGRFDRAVTSRERLRLGLPSDGTMTREDFMELTLDVWEIPPESATRVGHPAPFPVELPARLIDLYTYRGDLVLDPFSGSGSSAVAAVQSGRHYVGYDLDERYLALAEARVARALNERLQSAPIDGPPDADGVTGDGAAKGASRQVMAHGGRGARDIARSLIEAAGFTDVTSGVRRPGRVSADFSATDRHGSTWYFEVAGSHTTHRSGLRRTDVVWKTLGKVSVLHQGGCEPLVLLTTGLPIKGSAGEAAISEVTGAGRPIRQVIDMLDPSAQAAVDALNGPRRRGSGRQRSNQTG